MLPIFTWIAANVYSVQKEMLYLESSGIGKHLVLDDNFVGVERFVGHVVVHVLNIWNLWMNRVVLNAFLTPTLSARTSIRIWNAILITWHNDASRVTCCAKLKRTVNVRSRFMLSTIACCSLYLTIALSLLPASFAFSRASLKCFFSASNRLSFRTSITFSSISLHFSSVVSAGFVSAAFAASMACTKSN